MPVRTIMPPEQTQESDTTQAESDVIEDSLPAGPGWFESSWELFCGLQVIEESDDGFAQTV